MMQAHVDHLGVLSVKFNECVIANSVWEEALPNIIEAFVFVNDGSRDVSSAEAIQVQRAFRAAYPDRTTVPVVEHTVGEGFRLHSP